MRRLLTCLSVLALALSLAPAAAVAQDATPTGPRFADSVGNVHEDNILRLADRGVTLGCAEGRFCPEAPVTRQEMATFLARALGLSPVPGPSRFNDVQSPAHGPNIDAIAQLAITSGVTGRCTVPTHDETAGESAPGDPRFCPLDPVTRNQMAVFLQRAFELRAADPQGLRDLDASATNHIPAIGAVLSAGVTRGCNPGDRYCGGDLVRRGQMASFLIRALDVVGRSSPCPTTAPTQPQVLDVATQGFPVNSAVADPDNDRLYLFTNALSPQRLVVVRLSDREVLRSINVPGSGSRVWAVELAGDHLYFGRWGTGDAHSLYRVPRADLLGGGTPSFQPIGMEGLGGSTPLDNRLRGNDGLPLTSREFWDLTSDDEGRIYAGTGRQEVVYRFTPPEVTGDAAGQVEVARLTGLPTTDASRQITALQWTPSGLVVGTGRGQGLARVVDPLVLDPAVPGDPAASPREVEWSSRPLRLGSRASGVEDGVFGIYGITAQQPTADAPGRVVLTTEEERARMVEYTIPPRPLDGAPAVPLPNGTATVWRVPVDEPILTRPGFAPPTAANPAGNPVAVGTSTTRLYEAVGANLQPRSTPVPADVTRSMFTVAQGGSTVLVGVTASGTVWSRPSADATQTTTTSLTNSPLITRAPERPQSLGAARVGNRTFAIVGGNNKVTVHTLPSAGSTSAERPAQDVSLPGEAKTVTAVGATVYAATYPGGELRSFTIGAGGQVGAAQHVVSWSDRYNRPRDIVHDAHNDRLVVAAKSDFEGFGAIISVRRDGSSAREYDTSAILSPSTLASQEPLTLAAVPGSDAVVIGTPNGYVVGFDHVRGRKLWEVRPTTGSVRGLTVTDDGVVHGVNTAGVRFTIVDGARGVVTVSPSLNPQAPGTSSLLTDSAAGQVGELTQVAGQLVVGTANRLVAIDPSTGAERLLSQGPAPTTFTTRAHAVAVPGTGCSDVLTFRTPGTGSTAHVARAPVVRP